MSRRFVKQLGENETIDEVFLVSEKQLRTNRNGNLFLQMRLRDRSGSVTAMMWNANDRVYGSFDNGDFLHIHGATQFYNGSLQMIVNRIEPAIIEKIDESDFVTLGSGEIEKLLGRAGELLRDMRNCHLRNLAECCLKDEALMAKFAAAPAGIKHHHAYRGGLLDHVVSLMELAAVVAPRYPDMDPDLLMIGAFLHDIGKVEELTYDKELGYSDAGQLLGHVVIATHLIDQKIRETVELSGEAFPDELRLQVQHMILSHHGSYEFGSPKLPMTLEALVLHLLDTLDSKYHAFAQIMQDDANADSSWTPYQAALGRKLYKGE